MFVFGDPVQAARLYLDDAVSRQPPLAPYVDKHYDEMTLDESIGTLAWLQVAVTNAQHEGLAEEVYEVLVEWYTEAFKHLVGIYPSFRERILTGHARIITERSTWDKYIAIAREASEN